MKKIANWENIQEATGFQRLAPNGYIIKILKVEDNPDREYLKLYFDIAEGDNKGYFKKEYDTDTRPEKKWPNAGTFIRSYKEAAQSMFKGFTNAIENSNKNYKWDFDENKLVGKTVGVIIGDEEYMNQKGAIRTRNYVSAIRSVDTIKKGEFKIPELKMLDAAKTAGTATKNADFVNPFGNSEPTAVADDVPFEVDDDNPFA